MSEEFSDSRRKFLGFAIGGIAGAIALGYAIPLATYLVEPALQKTEEPFAPVGSIEGLQPDQPTEMTFMSSEKVGWEEKKVERDVWVVKKPDSTITVFSPICPHLGCGYNWNPAKKEFICPCHGSVFTINGRVLAGPAPRPLDTLPFKIENGILYVRYEKFRIGIPEKELA